MKMIPLCGLLIVGMINAILLSYAGENTARKPTKISWNTRNLPINNFGIIKEKKSFNLLLPEINKKKLYSFVPTVGPATIRNKQIKILLVAFSVHIPPVCGIDKSIESELIALKNEFPQTDYILKIYGQIHNECQWTQMAQLMGQADENTLQAHIDIEPNASLTLSTGDSLTPSSLSIDMANPL